MEKNIQRHGLINLLILLVAAVADLAVARHVNSLAGQVAVVFLGLGVAIAIVSWFQMRLREAERIEKLELDELARSRGDTALFQARYAEGFPAQRSREQFERYFVPVFTVLLFLAQAGGAWLLWLWLTKSAVPELDQPTVGMATFGLVALALFLVGKFSAAFARLEQHRLLRPGASYVLLGAYLSFVVGLGIVAVRLRFPMADLIVAKILCAILALVALETLINLVLEIYRPRIEGKIGRPLYESRLIGLLGQPESLFTAATEALDYQFGFKVSETWFFQFLKQRLPALFLLQLCVLLLSTCVVVIQAGEGGLLERFGRPVPGRTLLTAGAHLKFPWPIDRVYRYQTDQIQSFEVGFDPGEIPGKEEVVLWSVAHTKEENFLVANRETSTRPAGTKDADSRRTPPVSLVTGSIVVQFQIRDLLQWEYRNEDANGLLQDLANREIVRYLAAADLNELMSYGREAASQALVKRIQEAADKLQLGANILLVGLQDLHPPVKVAPEYEKVISAAQTKQARILTAQADAIRTNALAGAQSTVVLNQAKAEQIRQEIRALAQAALFTNQIPAFEAAPSIYMQRAYLQTFVPATANARKYVLLTTNTHDVLTFDLQEKIRTDMGDISAPAPKK